MRVGTDNHVTGCDQSLLWQQGMFHAHLPAVVKSGDVHLGGKVAATAALLGRLYILVWGEMIHHQCDFVAVENGIGAHAAKLVDGHRCCDVVGQHPV